MAGNAVTEHAEMHDIQLKNAAILEDQKERDGSNSQPETGALDLYIDPAKEVKLLAKLDLCITPVIMVVYLSCFLDRANIGELLSYGCVLFTSMS